MVLKRVLTGLIFCATLASWNGASLAAQYRPDEFLGMDLSKTALSPTPLGPPSTFVPAQAAADHDGKPAPAADHSSKAVPAQASLEPETTSHIAAAGTAIVAAGRPAHRLGAARAKLARRHGSPLDAEALDTRIQVWPCKSGGICNWKR